MFFAFPTSVAAHAELVSSTPADGAVVAGTPDEIILTYSEAMDPAKSSITLHPAGGAEIARGGVDPDNDTVMRMTPPELEAGAYEIRSTATALDGHIEHEIVKFTVSEPTPAPATPSPTPSASPTVAPTASPTASPSASPSPSAAGDQTPTSTTDLLIPILAVLLIVAVLGTMLVRNRSRGGGPA
jgi:methionine-rich copper-binding protein CopC